MHFVVRKTKPGFFEDEYEVTLTDKAKDRLRKVALFTAVFGPAAYLTLGGPLPSKKTETSETPTSD